MNRRLALFRQDRFQRDRSVKEGRRDFVAPIFAKRDFDYVGEGMAIQDCADGIPHVEHQHPQAAVSLVRTRAADVRRMTDASNRCQWAIDHANDLAKFDLFHGSAEGVAAIFSASAFHISSPLQLTENLFEEFDR